jgi:hypothetical protein
MNERLTGMLEQMMEAEWTVTVMEMDAAGRLALAGCEECVIYAHVEAAMDAEMRFLALKSLAPDTDPLGLREIN